MCGIAGFVDKRETYALSQRKRIVRSMLRAMRHRGGDSSRLSTFKNVCIGHTRLAIVDLSPAANQPVVDVDATLAFSGEIYNHLALRKESLPYAEFESHSDTSTLFALFKQLPRSEIFRQIQGMYALSFLDKKIGEIILAVDSFSIKPLYYVDTPIYFAWASEAKAFAHIPGLKFAVNQDALSEYLVFRHVAGEKTLFRNIRKLRGGEVLRFSLSSNTYKKQIFYSPTEDVHRTTPETLGHAIEMSVNAHLMSDVPVGLQLSGGVDSSLVAVLAAKLGSQKLHTFSIGLKENAWNEFTFSDLIAKMIGSVHHKIIFSANDFKRLLPKITYHLDEPLVHPNTVPMYMLAKVARKYTKVLLTGEGADEIFCGYQRHAGVANSDTSILFSNAFVDARQVRSLLKYPNSNLGERIKIVSSTRNLPLEKRVSIYDIQTYLPHVLLRQDKAGMAANVENRVPYLYPQIVQFGLGVKTNFGIFGAKTPLKKAALKYLPKELVLRRKCGFGLPIDEWFRGDGLFTKRLLDLRKHPVIKDYFHARKVSKLVSEHISGKEDNSSILFSLVALAIWYDVFISSG